MFKPQFTLRSAGRAVARIPIDAILPGQPPRRATPESVRQLAESIHRHGQLSPVLVRRCGNRYALIAGQRRLMALKLLGRAQADAIVLDVDDCDSALIALTENRQREALHYLDEAEALRRILDRCPITRDRLARSLGLSPAALADRLALLKLPEPVQAVLRQGRLSERHARALLRLEDETAQLALAREAAEGRMSVRRLEDRIDALLKPAPAKPTVSRHVRDNRIIINAVTDTVRELNRIGVSVQSRVEEHEDHIDVVVTIPVRS